METETGSKDIFGMEATVSQSAAGIIRLLVLMRMDEMLRQEQAWLNATEGSGEKNRLAGRTTNSIKSLLRFLAPRMKTKIKNKKVSYEELVRLAEEQQAEAIEHIMDYLENDLALTKIDTRQEVDMGSITERNKAFLGY